MRVRLTDSSMGNFLLIHFNDAKCQSQLSMWENCRTGGQRYDMVKKLFGGSYLILCIRCVQKCFRINIISILCATFYEDMIVK